MMTGIGEAIETGPSKPNRSGQPHWKTATSTP